MDAGSLTEILAALDGDSAVHLILQTLRLRPSLSPAVVHFACPSLTYAPSRSMTERRCRGVLRQFDETQGVGLITSPEIEATFGMEVLVQQNQLKGFQVGDEISFTCVLSQENKPVAFELLTAFGLPHFPGASDDAKRRRRT
ncbi:Sperm-associated antigen 6 [Durusdinium trenchii]|uniref:Sperm-associated antigen 6 n=1 Tax=Durusdinium trenchii TaxID=1381693 RepID=A0ABP0I5Q9_9DINO